ncbi:MULTISPECIES: O-antigen ligase family protein [Leptolyngbya]|uniref:O-antigen polymerase n=2 Tax=Leptolyngbya boryana TaxID=1184 RepID=A0A1Z4JKB0_LEPBY|nr:MULTISPECIES: O-antigen ligase [Leptolyngbya]MBD2367158.1 O-antigen ligase family protein [Leptolyngbya sp. FACHB-161]MBD2373488.1 O-antigen ligase family protein [Leptolyngbya sp. FACHB-238]MBD2397897.1 O-antigen ligase family protein [Leptolyngbya sp. FACHB-239]MBD2404398.1 O-antigen ligase family protein [Leptolyngbya sp. FACHB-402]BAY57088.1 O-antigen polymerase [Leptolyngbya boryana NIES-2135]
MKKLLLFAETCFVIFGLTFFTGGLALGGSEDGTTSGPVPVIVMTAIRYFIWLVSTLLVMLNAKRAIITVKRDWILWLFIGIVLFSFAWSDFPQWTLLANREVLQMTTFGLYIATRFSLTQQVKLYAMTFAIGGLASAALALGVPSIGKHLVDHPGAWKGIYDYKNTFGSMMVIAMVSFFALPIEHPRDRWLKWIGIAGATALILLSTSRTALLLGVAMLAMMTFYRNFRWQGRKSIVLGSLGVLVLGSTVVGVLSNWTELLKAFGRDPTLTGRTYIWSVALDRLWDRPWFGFGRSAFWSPESPYPKAIGYYLSQSFNAPHAHNGFIEVALDVGLVGLALFLICYVIGFVMALMKAYGSKHPEHLWALGFLTFLALNNVTESYMLRLANIYWVLFVATILTVKQKVPAFEDERERVPEVSQLRQFSESQT